MIYTIKDFVKPLPLITVSWADQGRMGCPRGYALYLNMR
jgi:hypothetical protein